MVRAFISRSTSRVGDALPTSNSAQRLDRLRMAMAGYVPDGLLARFSLAGNEEDSFDRLAKFAAELLNAVSMERLPALIGRSVGMADRSEERRVGKECVSTCRSRW